jgi:Domain of unknown function (DUF4166)/Saccharopine dehydrogenase NADP binding domain
MDRPLTVLIVGGYGTFGGRLARLLADRSEVSLLIGGRSLDRAEEFCSRERSLRASEARPSAGGSALTPVRFDRSEPVEAQLRALAPDIVVDASGPFQAYGHEPYRLVEACIDCGIHYLDLADSAEFVCGIDRFDERAREQRVFVLSGVSSFPVLTAAVVRSLSAGMGRVEEISGGIAPSPFANVGLNVIRAIAGYAGKPIRLRDGRESAGERVGHALTETLRYTIAAPGRVPLRSIEFSLVDVPDLQLLAKLWPECRRVWMGAGPVPAVWHRLLRGLAWLVRLRLLPSLSFLSTLMYWASNAFSWGEHRGGMFVRVVGADASGARVVRSWHLVAEGDAGPFIPSMAAEAIIRRCLAGPVPGAGARAAVHELEVADYEPLLARRAIQFGERDDTPRDQPLYQRILGSAWEALPATLRAMHSVGTSLTVSGLADVTRGTGWLASSVASLIGFPTPGTDVPVEVAFTVTPTRETWARRFASRAFSSEQFAGTGRFERLVCERFGPVTLALALVVEAARLRLVVRGWSFLGIPLPRALAPRCDAHEEEIDGCFHFDVAIGHRWTGLIVHYRGWLRATAVEFPAPCLGGETGRRKGLKKLSTQPGND